MALFNDCACTIQAAWRGHNVRQVLRPVITTRMEEYRQHRAAITIQKHVRGTCTRHLVDDIRSRHTKVRRWMDWATRSMGIDPSLKLAAQSFRDSTLASKKELAELQGRALQRATEDLLANVAQIDLVALFSPPTTSAPKPLLVLAGAVRSWPVVWELLLSRRGTALL